MHVCSSRRCSICESTPSHYRSVVVCAIISIFSSLGEFFEFLIQFNNYWGIRSISIAGVCAVISSSMSHTSPNGVEPCRCKLWPNHVKPCRVKVDRAVLTKKICFKHMGEYIFKINTLHCWAKIQMKESIHRNKYCNWSVLVIYVHNNIKWVHSNVLNEADTPKLNVSAEEESASHPLPLLLVKRGCHKYRLPYIHGAKHSPPSLPLEGPYGWKIGVLIFPFPFAKFDDSFLLRISFGSLRYIETIFMRN